MRVFLLVLIVFAPLAVSAQAPTEGFFVTPRLLSAGVASESEQGADSGGGLGLRVGYGFTKTVSVFVALEGASITPRTDAGIFGNDEAYALGSFDVGAQFNLLPSNGVNPILRVGLNGSSARYNVDFLDTEDDPEIRGTGLTLGGGVEIGLSQALGLELAMDLVSGRVRQLEVGDLIFEDDGDAFATARLGLGLVWRP